MSSAEGTGFPMKFSPHRSDSSDLFVHSASDEGVSERGEPPAVGSHFVVIRACSTIPSKWDGENTVEEGRVSCQKGGMVSTRNLRHQYFKVLSNKTMKCAICMM